MFKKITVAAAVSAALTSVFTSVTSLAEITQHNSVSLANDLVQMQTLNHRFIVKLKSNNSSTTQGGVTTDNANPIVNEGQSAIVFKKRLASGDYVIEAKSFTTLEVLKNDLLLSGEVISIEQDTIVYSQQIPNDYYAPTMYSIENSQRGINAIDAWGLSTGKGITVAIIDTGFSDHPDYDIRTINGYDLISSSSAANDGDGRDSDAHDAGTGIGCDSRTSSWHGSHVAGIIGATMNNSIGAVGIAPEANLLHIRVLGRCDSGYTSDVIDGIYWAAGKQVASLPLNQTPVDVINLSLGAQRTCGAYQSAIDYARAQGITIVVSAGNNNIDASAQSPANCLGVIAVAATDNTGDKASYSNFSAYNGVVDLAAPGSSIISTVNQGSAGPESSGYSFKSGTSMAAPQVAGVVALMLEKNPDLTPDEIEDILKTTANQFPSPSTCLSSEPICGAGMVNAKAAVLKAIERFNNTVTVLENGVVQQISAAEKEELLFSFSAPATADVVTVSLASGSGDADLYVKKGAQATLASYDCRPWLAGNNETCTLAGGGDYSVMVKGYNAFTNVDIVATSQDNLPVAGTEIGNDDVQWNLSGVYNDELLFWADVPQGVSGLWVQLWGGTGDADLWVKKGSAPTRDNNDCYQSNTGNQETCTMSNEAGRYYIKVRGYSRFDNAALRIIWQ